MHTLTCAATALDIEDQEELWVHLAPIIPGLFHNTLFFFQQSEVKSQHGEDARRCMEGRDGGASYIPEKNEESGWRNHKGFHTFQSR